MQEEAVMLNLEVLSQELRDMQLSPAEEARAVLNEGTAFEMTTEEWQSFTDFFSPETQENIARSQAGMSRGRGNAISCTSSA